jgi:hypothetical protein
MVDFGYIYLLLFVPLAEKQAEAAATGGSRIKCTERRLVPLICLVHTPPGNAIAMQNKTEENRRNREHATELRTDP